jgi:uncharacterized protein (TIGR03546 family)
LKSRKIDYIKKSIAGIFAEGSSPSQIALGFAIGICIGCMPIMGIQMLTALAISYRFKANKLATIVGSWISNAVTFIPLYFFNYKVAVWIFPQYESITKQEFTNVIRSMSFTKFMDFSGKFLIPLFAGSLIVGVIGGILVYFISKSIIIYFYKRKHIKMYKLK